MTKELFISITLTSLIHAALIFSNFSWVKGNNPVVFNLNRALYSMEVSLVPLSIPGPEKEKKEIKDQLQIIKKVVTPEPNFKLKKKIEKIDSQPKALSVFSAARGARKFRQAVCLSNDPPLYPALARILGYEGSVELEILVDEKGNSKEVRVVKSSGYAVLDNSAGQAANNWKFIPAKKGEKNIETRVLIPVVFNLEE